ncbi:cupin domain-containing protein [Klebsiella pneumoniae]|nr:cupin domain-containing protein [Klebsiella pneumoniae]
MQARLTTALPVQRTPASLASLLPAFGGGPQSTRGWPPLSGAEEEAQADRAGKSFVLARMVELLFIEAIRSSGTLATPGLMRGLRRPAGRPGNPSAASGPARALDGQRPGRRLRCISLDVI